jgi:hypothetical protein
MVKKGGNNMRITDNRYTGEMEKFDLALRMIQHEARTGTIRACTGFTEDRIRKLYATYFSANGSNGVRRRRGKSPRQITRFVSNAQRQMEATLLACLFLFCDAATLDPKGRPASSCGGNRLTLGQRLCQAYEAYRSLHPEPRLSFEWTWNLYHSLVDSKELYFSWCDGCFGPYIQDSYALDYRRCPFCELKDQARDGGSLIG